jgi:molybdenum cofactor cytidylyltransferase
MEKYHDQAIVLLAAGSSSRMGTPKQMLIVNGRTMLQQAVNSAIASLIPNIIVVLGANAEQHDGIIKERAVMTIINKDWEKGMGSSLKAGLKKAISQYPTVQAVMVLVCDQPLLSSVHINKLATEYHKTQPMAIASRYNGINGVPAIFDRSIFSSLMMLKDESGAREVLKKLENNLITIPFEGGEIDLDTPDDYKNFIEGKV